MKKKFSKTTFGEKLEQAIKIASNKPETKKNPEKSGSNISKVTATRPVLPAKTPAPPVNNQQKKPPSPPAVVPAVSQNFKTYRNIMSRNFEESLLMKRALRIHLGIDFGTSYSKVVWKSSSFETCYPVRFGKNENNLEDYLIPSMVAFENGCLKAGLSALTAEEKSHKISNFKVCLACETAEQKSCEIKNCSLANWSNADFPADAKGREARFVTAYFLGRLIRRAKSKIIEDLESQGVNPETDIRWSATLAVPDKFMEQPSITAGFRNVLESAWLMSEFFAEKSGLKSIGAFFECYLAACDLTAEIRSGGKSLGCSLHSEVGAEVASITLSPTSEEGLYAFVDVGAGTVDASVFRFFRGEYQTSHVVYAADVFNLGAAHIEAIAYRNFSGNALFWLKQLKECNGITGDAKTFLQPANDALVAASGEIQEKTATNLISVFRNARQKENSTLSWQSWKDLKLVLGGGGAAIPAYRTAATEAFSLKGQDHKPGEVQLEVPANFMMYGLPHAHFHRFAVAYGLVLSRENPLVVVDSNNVKPVSDMKRREIIDPTNDG